MEHLTREEKLNHLKELRIQAVEKFKVLYPEIFKDGKPLKNEDEVLYILNNEKHFNFLTHIFHLYHSIDIEDVGYDALMAERLQEFKKEKYKGGDVIVYIGNYGLFGVSIHILSKQNTLTKYIEKYKPKKIINVSSLILKEKIKRIRRTN